jgi:hypothetical protein
LGLRSANQPAVLQRGWWQIVEAIWPSGESLLDPGLALLIRFNRLFEQVLASLDLSSTSMTSMSVC